MFDYLQSPLYLKNILFQYYRFHGTQNNLQWELCLNFSDDLRWIGGESGWIGLKQVEFRRIGVSLIYVDLGWIWLNWVD